MTLVFSRIFTLCQGHYYFIRMYLRTDVDVLPKIVKPEDAPTPRKLSVRTLPKRERKRVVRGLLAEAATP